MAALACIFAAILAFADKKLRVEEDPLINEINHLLPGVNCSACGYLNCHDFAEHIVKDGVNPAKCRVVSEENRGKICALAGVRESSANRVVALVHCSAKSENKKPLAEYNGIKTCAAAHLVFGAGMECQYGCIGLGDCERECSFDAIHVEEALAVVDTDKCTGCGKCVEVCPRGIIDLKTRKFDKLFYVACSSQDSPVRVKNICGVGCLGCGICEKLSPEKYFVIKDNLSYPAYDKQDKEEEVRTLKDKCPTKVIKELD
jgi:RnfABCDGE-type electron transport complex B subunit